MPRRSAWRGKTSQARFPFVRTVFADSVYAGEKVATATSIVVEIVRKLPDQVGFQVLPRRWVVERFFAWINRNRRLAKDFEACRAAYLAGFHAAQALLFENPGRTPKTHSGAQSELARLVKNQPRIDQGVRAFLARTYNLKAIADCETGPDSNDPGQAIDNPGKAKAPERAPGPVTIWLCGTRPRRRSSKQALPWACDPRG
jgi:HEPN domain-containing protein